MASAYYTNLPAQNAGAPAYGAHVDPAAAKHYEAQQAALAEQAAFAQYSTQNYGYGPGGYGQPSEPAKPKRVRYFIWFAFIAMVGLLLVAASVTAVVTVADNRDTMSWHVGPTVALAILATINTAFLTLLLAVGINITWWKEASRGTTVAQLHNIWSVNHNLILHPHRWKDAWFSGSSMHMLVPATMFIILSSFAIPPLLQQAVKPQIWVTASTPGLINLDLLAKLPSGLTGTVDEAYGTSATASYDYLSAAADWYNKDPIPVKNSSSYRCDGSCSGVVLAPGITANCSSKRYYPSLNASYVQNLYLFDIWLNLTQDNSNAPMLDLRTTYVESINASCVGTLVFEQCSVYSALTNYAVNITDSINVQSRNTTEWNSTIRADDSGDLPLASIGTNAGPLRPLMYLHNSYLASYTYKEANTTYGSRSSGYMTEALHIFSNQTNIVSVCKNTWKSPTASVLNAMGETLFRLSLIGNATTGRVTNPPSVPSPTSIPITASRGMYVFSPDYRWFAGAMALILACIGWGWVLIWGWWTLKRDISMSPLECAQVFSSLGLVGTNMSASDLMKVYGPLPIRYAPEGAVMMMQPQSQPQASPAAATGFGQQSGYVQHPGYEPTRVQDAGPFSQQTSPVPYSSGYGQQGYGHT